MKAKYIIITLIVNYLLIVVFCAFSEFLILDNKATEVTTMIQTAADMALEQVQATDDFFQNGKGYMLDTNTSSEYTIKATNKLGVYSKVNPFAAATGRNTKESIFNAIYGNGKLENFIMSNPNVLDIEGTIGYWDSTLSYRTFYKLPRISQVGLDITGYSAKRAYFRDMPVTDQVILSGIWENYGLNNSKKETYYEGALQEYFVTPLSLGITYIDEDMLQYLFMNNLDLLMRSKYAGNGINLNTKEGGNGVLKTSIYSNLVSTELDNTNPINNGSFTLLRGVEVEDSTTGTTFYKGVKPKIRYKVIDMFDKSNDSVLSSIFGATPTVNGSKAEYFKKLSEDVIDPSTGLAYKHKPIVVAEVTFYADVVIPYSTVALREMRGKVLDDNSLAKEYLAMSNNGAKKNNFVDVIRNGSYGSGIPSPMGNNSDCIVYTKLFAVAP